MAKPKMYLKRLREVLAKHKRSNNETDEQIVSELSGMYEMPQAIDFEDGNLVYNPTLGQGLMNIPRSAFQTAGDIAQMGTLSGLQGLGQYGIGMGQSAIETLTGWEPKKYNYLDVYEQGTQSAIDRLANFEQTAYEDPVGAALDLLPVFRGATIASKVKRLPKNVRGALEDIGKFEQADQMIIQQAGQSISKKMIEGLKARNAERSKGLDKSLLKVQEDYPSLVEGQQFPVEAVSEHPTVVRIRRKIAARGDLNDVLKGYEDMITTAGNFGDDVLKKIDQTTNPADAGEAMIAGLEEFDVKSKEANSKLYDVFRDDTGSLAQVPARIDNVFDAIEGLEEFTPELKKRNLQKASVKAVLNDDTVSFLLDLKEELSQSAKASQKTPEVSDRENQLWSNFPRPESDVPSAPPDINMQLLWELRQKLDDVINKTQGGFGLKSEAQVDINTNKLLKQIRSALTEDIYRAAEEASDAIDPSGSLKDSFVTANQAYAETMKQLQSKAATEIRSAAFSDQPERLNKLLITGDQAGFGGEPWLANSNVQDFWQMVGKEATDKAQQNLLVEIIGKARDQKFAAGSIQGQIDAINKNSPGRFEELMSSPFDEVRGEEIVKQLEALSKVTEGVGRVAKIKGDPAPNYGLSSYLKFRVAEDLVTKLLRGDVTNAMLAPVSMAILGGTKLYENFLNDGLRKKYIDSAEIGQNRKYPTPDQVELYLQKAGVPVARVGRVVGRAGSALEDLARERRDQEVLKGYTPAEKRSLERTLSRSYE